MHSLPRSNAAVIVRPDRYVFGFVDENWSLDDLIQELVRKLELLPPKNSN